MAGLVDDEPSLLSASASPLYPVPFQPLLLTPPSTTYFIIMEGLPEG